MHTYLYTGTRRSWSPNTGETGGDLYIFVQRGLRPLAAGGYILVKSDFPERNDAFEFLWFNDAYVIDDAAQ